MSAYRRSERPPRGRGAARRNSRANFPGCRVRGLSPAGAGVSAEAVPAATPPRCRPRPRAAAAPRCRQRLACSITAQQTLRFHPPPPLFFPLLFWRLFWGGRGVWGFFGGGLLGFFLVFYIGLGFFFFERDSAMPGCNPPTHLV